MFLWQLCHMAFKKKDSVVQLSPTMSLVNYLPVLNLNLLIWKTEITSYHSPWALTGFRTETSPTTFSSGEKRTMTERHGTRMWISSSWGKWDSQRERKVLTHVFLASTNTKVLQRRWTEYYLPAKSCESTNAYNQ